MSDATNPGDRTAAEAKLADAILAAAVKLADAKIADSLKMANAKEAADLKLADAAVAERKERREAMKTVYMPIVLAILVAIPGIIAAWRIGATHVLVNSMKDELVESVRKASRAEGVIEGAATKGKN